MSNQQKLLTVKLGSVKSQLTRFINYLNDFDANPDFKILETRLERVELNLLNDFDNYQTQLLLLETDDDYSSDRSEFEERYYSAIARARSLLNVNPQRSTPSQTNLQSTNDPHNVRLPPINLPEFDGSFDKFLQFFDTFKTIIHDSKTLTPTQKFYYLQSSLKGDALQTIQSIQISDQNYFIAWNLLCERYQNHRIIINSHIKSIFEIPSLNRESKEGLRQLLDTLQKNIRSLEVLGQPVTSWDAILIYSMTLKLDNTTQREWEYSIKGSQLPSFNDFIQFLNKKCQTLETLESNTKQSNPRFSVNRVLSHFSPINAKCYFCKGTHWLNLCKKFLELSPNLRLNEVKKMHLCTNCLRSNHTNKDCKSDGCRKCKNKHHTLLHFERNDFENKDLNADASKVSQSTRNVNEAQPEQPRDYVVTGFSHETDFSHVLLSTANVYICDKNGEPILCRVLLDSGSQSNYITYDLVKKLDLNMNKINLPVSGISQNLIKIKHSTMTTIKSLYNSFSAELNFLIIEKITEKLPSFSFTPNTLNIPDGIKLADDEFNKSKPISLLLGASIFYSLLCVGQIKLGKNLPLLQKTHLGWVISGPLQLNTSSKNTICQLNINNQKIEQQLEKFWLLEEGLTPSKLSQEELECEEYFSQTTTRDNDGKFIVSLPTKANINELGESKENAIKRFYAIEKRLNKNLMLKDQYSDFMNEYISLRHMSLVNEANDTADQSIYYMPHHCVLKDSSTTKVRVVFDASAKTSSGISLNDVLKIGPTIQDDLFSIIMRFRTYNYVITGDIEKMYRMVNMKESDRKLQRIIWRSSSEDELQTYQLNTVTYGTASASFLAIRSLHQVAYENLKDFPEACKIILRDFYVDDLIFGASNVSDAIRLKNDISNILASAGFILRKWASNNKNILKLNEDSQKLPQFFITDDKNIKTLGIFWDPNEDKLHYSVNVSEPPQQKITKRFILAVISRIFDPLGLLGPITIRAKLILQELWKQKLDWDETVPPDLFILFNQFHKHLHEVNEILIPRHILLKNYNDVTLHVFCDASLLAYGACVYLVSRDQAENYYSQLLCAKARVAPVKSVTLPRLELCGALLLAQLVKRVTTALNLPMSNLYFWTDSTIVLSWLRIQPQNLKTFVSNRIAEIQSLTCVENWRHVKSNENPADIISRGANPNDLTESSIWWSGPDWLRLDSCYWPNAIDISVSVVPELKKNTTLNFLSVTDFNILEKFSSLSKLKRIMSYCLRFIKNTRLKENKIHGPLSIDELNHSVITLVYIAQTQDFACDIRDLQISNSVKSKSRLASLDPFLDEGVIRVGGRLKNSNITYEHKHPLVLCNKNHLTKLIIDFEHKRLMHAGSQAVLASLRCQFWILNGLNTVKGVIRKCVTCFKAKPRISCPKMGNLPSSRVRISRPFAVCGIDFAGPFLVKDGKTRSKQMVKCYLCVFVCFATKAAHLELVSDMSLDAFLNAFKRFIFRRGIPTEIYSDNGSNFKAAANDLQKVYKYLTDKNDSGIQSYLRNNNIKWVFIPPRSPHFGGLWEACVKSAKFHLKRILGDAHLTFEQLYTVIIQIEGILNSRPITPLSNDPNDLEPLTPSHFLIGDIITSLPQRNLTQVPTNRLTNYQRLQQMIQHFWSRWQNEYLSNLQQRFKWKQSSSEALNVGRMVLLKEDGIPPLHWQIGRITEIHPGLDNQVRVVTVKTGKGIFKRSFSKVCPLPVEQ